MNTRLARSSLAQVKHLPGHLAHRRRVTRYRAALPGLDADPGRLADGLERDGVATTSLAELSLPGTDEMMAEAAAQLALMEQHRPASAIDRSTPEPPQVWKVTDLPAIADWGANPILLAIAERYFGQAPEFQGVHLRRDFANLRPVTTEFWHKDLEDRRMMKAIVYLGDVEDEAGPFEYVPRSAMGSGAAVRIHWRTGRSHAMGIDDDAMADIVDAERWRRCTGPTGSVVLMDPVAVFHHGKPRSIDRAALFFVYTSDRPLRPELCRQYRDDTFARPQ